MHRRRFLRDGALGAVAGSSIASSSCLSWADPQEPEGGEEAPEDAGRSDFLWVHGRLLREASIRENLFAFAARHDLSVILRVGMPGGGRTAADLLREPLATARSFGVTTWLAAGVFEHTHAGRFVDDDAARRTHLERLTALVEYYAERSDGGRVILWEEAPIGGRWTPDGAWSEAAIRNLRAHGAEVFAAQRRAIEAIDAALQVGIFVHFTYIVDSKTPELFATLMDDLRGRDALPDFTFTDFYRGNYEKDIGPTETNRTVRSLIGNAKQHTDDRDVFYLASPHTIKPNYTVSKQSMRMDCRAARTEDVDGIGWYSASTYRRTEQGFDAFVPNTAPEDDFTADEFGTLTVARDRLVYAYATSLGTEPGYERDETFDLWLRGSDLGFYDHRVSVRIDDGNWEFLGDVAGYRDGEHPYATAGRDHVAIFHALDRGRLLDGGRLDLRLETDAASDGADLTAAWLLPFDSGNYLAEHEARQVVDGRSLSEFALGAWRGPAALEPGAETTVSVPVSSESPSRSLDALTHPQYADLSGQLRARESSEGFDHASRFDLWVVGSGLAREGTPAIDLEVESDGAAQSLAEHSVATAAVERAAIFYGLNREAFLEGIADGTVEIRRKDENASVGAVFAMPYFGSGNLKSPPEAAELVEGNPQGARTFSDAVLDVE